MLDVLLYLQKVAPIKFEIVAVNMDQKQPGFPEHVLPEYLKSIGVEYHIIEKDTYSVVKEKIPEGKTTCSLCSRLRRGTLYTFADEIGATKMALGHHRDDIFLQVLERGARRTLRREELLLERVELSGLDRLVLVRLLELRDELSLLLVVELRELLRRHR